MAHSNTIRGAFALGCLGVFWGCATAQQPEIADGEDTGGIGGTSANAHGGSSGSGASGKANSGGNPGASGSLGTSGSSSTAGAHTGGGSSGSSGNPGVAGANSSAGTSSGGTSAAGSNNGGSAGTTNPGGGGMHAGGANGGTAGTNAAAGSTGTAGSTGAAGSTGTGGSGTGSGSVLFSDDFEDGATDKWVVSGGTWSLVSDGSKAYAQTATNTGSTVQLSAAGSSNWTDQIIEARVKVTAFGGQSTSYFAALYARYNGTDYYSLLLRSDGKMVIRKDKSSISNAVDASIAEDTWYTVRFEVVGSSLKGYLNGTLLTSTTDSSLTTGGIAVSTVNTTAEFDDIKVTTP